MSRLITDVTSYYPIIAKSTLFYNIPVEHYPDAFALLQASARQFGKGEMIQRLGEPLRYSGIVLEGTVEGSFLSDRFNKISMNHFAAGRSFAEALTLAGTQHSPIQLRALTDCTVLFLQLDRILTDTSSECRYQNVLSSNVIRLLAGQNVFSNLKLRIASQKSLRDKVLMYLHSLVPDPEGYLHIPFTQTALAEFLGVNRSALSRELGRMQDERLVIIDGKRIRLNVEPE